MNLSMHIKQKRNAYIFTYHGHGNDQYVLNCGTIYSTAICAINQIDHSILALPNKTPLLNHFPLKLLAMAIVSDKLMDYMDL